MFSLVWLLESPDYQDTSLVSRLVVTPVTEIVYPRAMTITAEREATAVTRPTIANVVSAEIEDLRRTLAQINHTDPDAVLDILDRITALHQAAEEIRAYVAENAPDVVTLALKEAKVDQDDLVGRPYGETVVRRLARDAGLPKRRPGPRPRRGTQAVPRQA